MTRANARELAVHLIYSRSFTGDEPEEVIETRLRKDYYGGLSEENEVYTERPSRKQLQYIDQVVVGTANRESELDEIIGRYSVGWDVKRISRLTRAILQVALFEIQSVHDVPQGVAASEAVRLAKKYDGDAAGSFVNGILGNYLRTEGPRESAPAEASEAPAEEAPAAPAEEAPLAPAPAEDAPC